MSDLITEGLLSPYVLLGGVSAGGITLAMLAPQGVPDHCTVVTFTNAAGEEDMMLEADVGVKKYRIGGPWHVCPKCGHEFPEKEMVEVNGTFYCTQFNDFIEAIDEVE